MPSKRTEQKQAPMIVTENFDQPEARNLLVTTTRTEIIETPNNHDMKIIQGNRDNWSNRIVYLLSIIGFVVDLGRLFRINFNLIICFFSYR
jgi:hypothetical protein